MSGIGLGCAALGGRPHNMSAHILPIVTRVCHVIDRVATVKLSRRLNAMNTSLALSTSA